MTPSFSVLVKFLSPSLMAKAVRTFDRLTLLIVGICWTVTIVVILFAVYTINQSNAAAKAAEEALVAEPALPRIQHQGVGGRDLKDMIDRLQRRYPEVTVTWQSGVLTISGKDGGRYRPWLMAIGQADTLYPQFHWRIQNFCVGNGCGNSTLMTAELVGDQVAFEKPQVEEIK